jgi:hypothetical protein
MKIIVNPKNNNSNDSENSFFCQIDSVNGIKDYLLGGRCVRAIGIPRAQNSLCAEGKQVTTYMFDLDYWNPIIQKTVCDTFRVTRNRALRSLPETISERKISVFKFHLQIKIGNKGRSYFYKTFSDDAPKFFTIESFENTGYWEDKK